MRIKIMKQCALIALLSLVSEMSFAAETRFCVINNVEKEVVLSAKIETIDPDDGMSHHIGTLNYVANIPGISSSMHPNMRLNKSCIVLETMMGGGHAADGTILSNMTPLPSSSKLITLKYTIVATALYDEAVCSSNYPSDWKWPDHSVASVFLDKNGALKCVVEINPDEMKK